MADRGGYRKVGFIWGAAILAGLLGPRAEAKTYVKHACSADEEWVLDEQLPKAWMKRFTSSIVPPGRKSDPDATFDGIYVAQRLKSGAQGPELRAIADYWVARSLFQSGLIHLAAENFNQMVQEIDAHLVGIQVGAIECLTRIHQSYPSLRYPDGVTARVGQLIVKKMSLRQKQILWEASLEILLSSIGSNETIDFSPMLALLRGAGPYESLARAWVAVRNGVDADAARHLEAFLAVQPLPEPLRRFHDLADLTLARIYSEEGQFDRAVTHFQAVSKASNYFAQDLADLAWTHLIARDYGAAVGAANDIRRSGLKRSFSPHADMAIAVSLFELCRYPDAMHASREYEKRYRPSLKWLQDWEKKSVNTDPSQGYELVVSFLKDDKAAPEPIGTEWIRSPVFQSLQSEINLLIDEKLTAQRFMSRSRKVRVPAANSPLASILSGWQKQLQDFMGTAPKIELELAHKIGEDLAETNRSLLNRLQAVDDEMEFLNTEIYDAAGEDIVWHNANRGFDRFAKQEGVTSDTEKSEEGSKMRWELKRSPSGGSTEEIWEDELGALDTAQLDLCQTKKKFLKRQKEKKAPEKTVGE